MKIGTDEVGTADVFGPVVVCACAIPDDNIDYIKTLGLTDSKKISDNKIRILAKKIEDKVFSSIIVLSNDKYNKIYPDNNLNMIKAKLHNTAIIKLLNKNINVSRVIIDGFCTKDKYLQYLESEKDVNTNVELIQKAESQYLEVACASVIARFIFLEEMDKISKELNICIQKGASSLVDKQLVILYQKYGNSFIKKYTKENFSNIKKLLSNITK